LGTLRAGALAGLAKGAGHFFSRTDIATTFSTADLFSGENVALCKSVPLPTFRTHGK